MLALLWFFLRLLPSPFKSTNRLEAENAALRHQVIVLQRKVRDRISAHTALRRAPDITADGIHPQAYIRNTCNITTTPTTTTSGTCVPTTYLVSTPDGATFGNGVSSSPSISEDGLFVSFTSTAANLLAQGPNSNLTGAPEIFERSTCVTTIASTDNTCTPVTMLISTPDGTTPADGASDLVDRVGQAESRLLRDQRSELGRRGRDRLRHPVEHRASLVAVERYPRGGGEVEGAQYRPAEAD